MLKEYNQGGATGVWIDLAWKTVRGTLPTRFASHVYKRHGLKLPTAFLSILGGELKALLDGGDRQYVVDLIDHIDWPSNMFGEVDSCFWNKRQPLQHIMQTDGYALRLWEKRFPYTLPVLPYWKQYVGLTGIGRTWMWYFPKFGYLLMNSYLGGKAPGIWPRIINTIIDENLPWAQFPCQWPENDMFVNNDRAIFVFENDEYFPLFRKVAEEYSKDTGAETLLYEMEGRAPSLTGVRWPIKPLTLVSQNGTELQFTKKGSMIVMRIQSRLGMKREFIQPINYELINTTDYKVCECCRRKKLQKPLYDVPGKKLEYIEKGVCESCAVQRYNPFTGRLIAKDVFTVNIGITKEWADSNIDMYYTLLRHYGVSKRGRLSPSDFDPPKGDAPGYAYFNIHSDLLPHLGDPPLNRSTNIHYLGTS